jgi:hypothetical protein
MAVFCAKRARLEVGPEKIVATRSGAGLSDGRKLAIN